MDSGCTQHMTNRKEWLQNFRASPIPYVLLGDEGKLPVKGKGDLVLQSVYGEVKLDNVLLVDKFSLNLISQSQLDSGGCKIFSDKGCLWVFGSDWKVIVEGSRKQGLYEMKLHEKQSGDKVTYLAEPEAGKVAREELRTKLEKVPIKELQQQALPMAAAVSMVDINLLHQRMGHAGHTRLKELVKKNMAAGAKVADGGEENLKCRTCEEAKATKAPHPKHGVPSISLPSPIYTWVTEIKKKSEVYTNFLDWKAEAERQSSKKLKVLRTDNGAEFINADIAERVNQSLLEGVRSLLADSNLPLHYWGDALGMACWLKKLLPTKGLAADITPHEAFYKRKPNLEFIRVWGCMPQYREAAGPDHKLLPRTKWGIHLGICPESKGWVIRDVETRKFTATRDVTFYERDTYLEWKGRKQGAVLKEAAASPTPVEEMIDGSEEGIGAANGSSDNDDYEDHTTPGFDWVCEVQELSSPSTEVEESEEKNDKGEEAGDNSTDEAGEEEAKISDVEESVAESACSGFSDPWRIIDTGDNEKVVAEIEDLLVDGAIVIGREIEGDTVQQGADDNAAVEKGGAKNENEEMGKGKRVKKPNPKYAQMLLTCCKDIHTHLLLTTTATALLSKGKVESYNLPTEPLTIEEALSRPHKEEWRAAIQEELDTLAERGTWELVNMPEGRKPVGVRWIFKIKTGDMGQLERFKAQLVAKGYTQVEGENFDQIYSPVSKLTTARTMLKMVTARGYFMVQLDIKNAFLYGILKETIYMNQPPGCEDGTDRKCCYSHNRLVCA
ncbi:unnamed protein product [Closterium sp. NIES-54]